MPSTTEDAKDVAVKKGSLTFTISKSPVTLTYLVLDKHQVRVDLSSHTPALKKIMKAVGRPSFVREVKTVREDKCTYLLCRLRPSTATMNFQELTNDLLELILSKIECHNRTQKTGNPARTRRNRQNGYLNRPIAVQAT